MIKETPCHNCTKREVGCHSYCEEYAQWCVKHKQTLDEERKERSFDNDLIVTKKLSITRMSGKKVGQK